MLFSSDIRIMGHMQGYKLHKRRLSVRMVPVLRSKMHTVHAGHVHHTSHLSLSKAHWHMCTSAYGVSNFC